jgi:L-lactate dehydrogenase
MIDKLIEERGEMPHKVHEQVEPRFATLIITIIEGNEASQFGIGIVAARIAEMVLRDERAVIPIGSCNDKRCRFRLLSDAAE